MAILGYVESLIGGLDANTRRSLTEVFRYLLPNTRFGPVSHQTKSESFQAYYVNSTTPTSTGEFSIVHGLERVPYLALPVLPMDHVGARLVPLTVTRAADASRVYLKTEAGSTSTPFSLLVE
jgi:hypothetical protein